MAYVKSKDGYPVTRRLQLAGEEIFFPLQMGNDWGKVRIGMLCSCWAISATNGGYAGTPNAGDSGVKWGLAICNGTQGFFSPAPTDVFAMIPGTYLSNRNQGTPTYANLSYMTFNQGACYLQKRGATLSGANTSNSAGVVVATTYVFPNHERQSGLYWDIDRLTTAGSFVVSTFMPTAAQLATQPNTTFDAFMVAMQSASTPTNTTNVHAGASTQAYTGSLNIFNTVSVFCNSTANFVLEIGALSVCRYT